MAKDGTDLPEGCPNDQGVTGAMGRDSLHACSNFL